MIPKTTARAGAHAIRWSVLAALLMTPEAQANPLPPIDPSQIELSWSAQGLMTVAAILFVETIILYRLVQKHRFHAHAFLLVMFLVNIVGWIVFNLFMLFGHALHVPRLVTVIVLELAVALIEAYVLIEISRNPRLRAPTGPAVKWREALMASVIANACSLSLGFLLLGPPNL